MIYNILTVNGVYFAAAAGKNKKQDAKTLIGKLVANTKGIVNDVLSHPSGKSKLPVSLLRRRRNLLQTGFLNKVFPQAPAARYPAVMICPGWAVGGPGQTCLGGRLGPELLVPEIQAPGPRTLLEAGYMPLGGCINRSGSTKL